MTTWVYLQSEPGLWTVGYYDPNGRWYADSDHGSREEAAQRVAWLNGASKVQEDDGGSYAEYLYRYNPEKYQEKFGER